MSFRGFKSDNFHYVKTKNLPGTLWNCKCDWAETYRDVTNNQGLGNNDVSNQGLGGNPALTGEIFSNDHNYFKGWSDEKKREIENYVNKKDKVSNFSIDTSYNLSNKSKKEINSTIKELNKEFHWFNNKAPKFDRLEGGTIMEVDINNNLSINQNILITEGYKYCPARELASAFSKLKQGKELEFLEEYAIENLYHEYVHTISSPQIKHLKGIEEVINETATQLYARIKYVEILDKYKVNSKNYEDIQFLGLGYKYECNILRNAFDNDLDLLEKFAKGLYTKQEYKDFCRKNEKLIEYLSI